VELSTYDKIGGIGKVTGQNLEILLGMSK